MTPTSDRLTQEELAKARQAIQHLNHGRATAEDLEIYLAYLLTVLVTYDMPYPVANANWARRAFELGVPREENCS